MSRTIGLLVLLALSTFGSAGADVLYDSLWIVDDRWMDAGSGNAIGGANGPLRQTTDAQIADDFEVPGPHRISVVVADIMSYLGTVPAEGMWVQFYPHDDGGNKPSEDVFAEVVVSAEEFTVVELESPLNFPAYRITMDLTPYDVVLGAGTWWVNFQPLDVETNGDWFWYIGSVSIETIGQPSHVRDGWLAHGNNYAPLWRSTVWIPHDFRGNNSLSMQINGVAVGGCTRDPEWLCDGDVDGDGQVNPVDSGLVQAAFGSLDAQDLCNYDLDCDGQINPVDAGIVQSLFGTCEPVREVCP
jgi:hypothetical protein